MNPNNDKKTTKFKKQDMVAYDNKTISGKGLDTHHHFLKQRRHSRRSTLAVVAIIVLLTSGFALSMLRSRDPSCEQKVSQYNSAVRSVNNYDASVKKVAQQIESDPGYVDSITCAYMVYTYYASEQNANKSRELLESMKALYGKGERIDTKLLDQKSLDKEEDYVELLEYNRDLGERAEGHG